MLLNLTHLVIRQCSNVVILLIIMTLALPVNSETTTPSTADSAAQFCYLPSKDNVSYSDVTSLPVESPNHIVEYGPSPLQYGELWLPKDQHQPNKPPLVILIHGGCWLNSFDIKHTHALSTALRHSGYAVWSIEYRRTGDEGGGWPGSLEDIELAINFILGKKSSALQQHFDNNKVAIIGHSAGGHLALLAGSKFKEHPSVKGVIGLAAIVDIEKYSQGKNSCERATESFMGGKSLEKKADYDQANPTKNTVHSNTLLLHGGLDAIVSPVQATFLAQAKSKIITGAGHFDMVHPGTKSFQALLQALAKQL